MIVFNPFNPYFFRYRHEVAFDGEFIYILGGGTASQAYDLVNVPAFNVTSREWKTIVTVPDHRYKKYPSPRKCQGSVQLENGNEY